MPKRHRHRKASRPVKTPLVERISADLRTAVADLFAPRPTPRAEDLSPERIADRLIAIVERHLALPPPVKADLSRISDDAFADRAFATVVTVETPVNANSVREMQSWVKQHWLWSASDMARYLNCDRSTIKRIESGTRQPNEAFAQRFGYLRQLRRQWLQERGLRDRATVVVESSKPLPRRWRVLKRIVKCSRCAVHFEQVNGRHRRCHTPECDARKKQRRKKK